jgi:hypothetical protein
MQAPGMGCCIASGVDARAVGGASVRTLRTAWECPNTPVVRKHDTIRRGEPEQKWIGKMRMPKL